MFSLFLSHAHWLAIFVSAIAYFALGSLWYSALFGKRWSAEVAKHGIVIKEPDKKQIGNKMGQTFLYNLIVVFSLAYLVFVSGSYTWLAGAKLGLLCGLGFGSMAIAISCIWESRSFALIAIDCGYALAGMIICGAILAAWH
ncbi:MAG: DUF1761 domain-containing protein [Chitinophagales bacterium]